MDQVVAEAGLDWLDTPDQAVVWGTALGLQSEIEGVLSRSLEDVQQGRATGARALLPDLVPELERGVAHGLRSGRGERRQPLLGLGDPRHRRDDVDPRDDRQLAVVVRRRRWWRVRRWLVGRRWRRRRRRLLGSGVRPRSADAAPNMSRIPSSPSIARGGRGRERQLSAVIRNFWVTRGDALGSQAAEPVLLVAERRETRRSRGRCRGKPRSPRRAHRARRRRTRAPPRASPCRGRGPGTRARATTRCAPCGGRRTPPASTCWAPIGSPSSSTMKLRNQCLWREGAACPPVVLHEARGRTPAPRPSSRPSRTASRRADGCRPWRPGAARPRRRRWACAGRGAPSEGGARRAARRQSAWSGRPWAADGTLRPWVLSRRWKTSSRS